MKPFDSDDMNMDSNDRILHNKPSLNFAIVDNYFAGIDQSRHNNNQHPNLAEIESSLVGDENGINKTAHNNLEKYCDTLLEKEDKKPKLRNIRMLENECQRVNKHLRSLYKLRVKKKEDFALNISKLYKNMHIRQAQLATQHGKTEIAIINWRIVFEEKYLSYMKQLIDHINFNAKKNGISGQSRKFAPYSQNNNTNGANGKSRSSENLAVMTNTSQNNLLKDDLTNNNNNNNNNSLKHMKLTNTLNNLSNLSNLNNIQTKMSIVSDDHESLRSTSTNNNSENIGINSTSNHNVHNNVIVHSNVLNATVESEKSDKNEHNNGDQAMMINNLSLNNSRVDSITMSKKLTNGEIANDLSQNPDFSAQYMTQAETLASDNHTCINHNQNQKQVGNADRNQNQMRNGLNLANIDLNSNIALSLSQFRRDLEELMMKGLFWFFVFFLSEWSHNNNNEKNQTIQQQNIKQMQT